MRYVSGFGGTFHRSLFLCICPHDCYIETVIRNAGGGGNGDGKYRILRSRAKILGLGDFTAQARCADFPVLA